MVKEFAARNKYLFSLILLFLVSELIVWPAGEFPLNDDWSFAKSVIILLNDGIIFIGDWASMTLMTHIYWGGLFAKVFGFSFFILRLSTLVSSILGGILLFALVKKISGSEIVSFFGAAVVLFSPVYFNLSNTFMTDVNFNTLIIMICYFSWYYFTTARIIFLVLVFVCSYLLVLLRQYGMVIPFCFTFACLFMREKKFIGFAISLILTGIIYMAFLRYEDHVRMVTSTSATYKFAGEFDIFSTAFINMFVNNLLGRYDSILLNILLYTGPFAVLFISGALRKLKSVPAIIAVLLCAGVSYFLFKDVRPLSGNIFTNMNLGAETMHQMLYTTDGRHSHSNSPVFEQILIMAKFIMSGAVMLIIFGFLRTTRFSWSARTPFVIFLFCVLFGYLFMILITQNFFDRYHIPAISIVIMLLAFIGRILEPDWKAAVFPLLCIWYVSTAGTRDYFTVTRQQWKAYSWLHDEQNIPTQKINAGFEINCWDDGKQSWWQNIFKLEDFDYLIQFRKEEGFVSFREYPFNRTFPFKKDTLRLYIRETLLDSANRATAIRNNNMEIQIHK